MKLIAIIPARGGSKGIPHKNIIDICGLPMIVYTIQAALKSKIFSKIVVTTDSKEIKDISLQLGVDVIDRPSSLSRDDSSIVDVIEHALKSVIADGSIFTHFMLLQPTSPLRNEQHIKESFDVYNSKDANSLVSVNLSVIPPQKTLIDMDGKIQPLTKLSDLTQNRQNLPVSYHPNGAIYISKIDNFLKDKNLFLNPLHIYLMDEISSLDVDNIDDLNNVREIVASANGKSIK
ncbi:CMP-N-acetylneuraminic acid synthetase [Campylobacter iguaniorum]|uniref:acylneuraminate cytidylyltransferase family protein n=1 Tax=Campylobacter iguaniorum TaxID=1244531 RepID=UPI0007C93DBC|nr:acylneuraminate cytidylyltransferase family protein [Campylobacter iguaniorum]ANE35938.1 CMP-N-acetylneuraminic acid synthetase [Campylobacter iguaniorum]